MADDIDYDFDKYAEPHDEVVVNGPWQPPPSETGNLMEGITPLGYDRGIYFYLSRATRQVSGLTPEAHTQKALMGLASLPHYWQRSRFVGEKGNIWWDQAADFLMTACRSVGIYDPDRVRGRGAWWDDGRAVLHLGDHLLVDGEQSDLELPSIYIYPRALRLSIRGSVAPLGTQDAHKLLTISEAMRWERPISARLFAGWVVCALVCGALRWRPSIWITGASGSGKSWLSDNVLGPVVGPIGLQVQSKTSEAGIRQSLQSDARPVIFDEFEREDSTAAARVQGVLDLMRQSSSESEKVILKGTQNQQAARAFRIRSCFAFSSINVAASHAADESRLTVLALKTADHASEASQCAFQAVADLAASTLGPDYAAGLLARSVGLLREIRANAETFAVAVASRMGTRRAGDQLGALLAGAYSLHSTGLVTPEFAAQWLPKQDWGDATGAEVVKDEVRLFSHLAAARVRVSIGNGPSVDASIGRLIEAAFGGDDRIPTDTACLELREHGIRPEIGKPWGCWVSSNHPALKRFLGGTPWESNWLITLRRLVGEGRQEKVVRFGTGHSGLAIMVPLSVIDPSGTGSD